MTSSNKRPQHPSRKFNGASVTSGDAAPVKILARASRLAVLFVATGIAVSCAAEFEVLPEQLPDGPKTGMLRRYLLNEVTVALDRRAVAYEKIKTEADARAYQEKMKSFFVERLGEFPERTPLNARRIGRIERDGYSVEKIIFESRPNFHVTGLLYLPSGKGPFPGLIVPCGHSENGKAAEKYQRVSILLAKQGIVSFCYDPLGQGERHQVMRPDGKTIPGLHTVLGVSCIPLGTNFAQFRIWDGMRALDYLASRPEVDPKRLGCTGNSGGGTLTSYLMALDDRIVGAAPSCYITSFRSLLAKNGPQDAEQNIYGQVAFGMTHAEYVMMRAPKPTLLCTATRDAFDIHGSWEVFRESKRFYARFGFPERVDLVETDEGHGFHTQLREGTTRWMNRWLANKHEPVFEPAFDVLTDAETLCTDNGQVLHLPGERTLFDLNADTEDRLEAQRKKLWSERPASELLQRVRELAVIRPLNKLTKPSVETIGNAVARPGYELRKLTLSPEPGIALPVLAFVPEKRGGPAVLYVDGAGKQAGLQTGEFERLARGGTLVVVIDLVGLGELHDPKAVPTATLPARSDYQAYFLAYLLEKSLVGIWSEEILSTARWLSHYDTRGGAQPVRVIGVGGAAPAVLHAAALHPELFAAVELRQALDSWAAVVRDRAGAGLQIMNLVHGALAVYDLPDLRRVLGSQKLTVINLRGSQDEPLASAER